MKKMDIIRSHRVMVLVSISKSVTYNPLHIHKYTVILYYQLSTHYPPHTLTQAPLDESNFTGSFHGITVSSKTTESLLNTVSSDQSVATVDFDTVEGLDGSTDLLLVGAGVTGEDEGVVVFDATHGTFGVDREFDDGVGVGAGDDGDGSSAGVLGGTGETQSARQTESAVGTDFTASLGISSTEGSLTSTFSLLNNSSVYVDRRGICGDT